MVWGWRRGQGLCGEQGEGRAPGWPPLPEASLPPSPGPRLGGLSSRAGGRRWGFNGTSGHPQGRGRRPLGVRPTLAPGPALSPHPRFLTWDVGVYPVPPVDLARAEQPISPLSCGDFLGTFCLKTLEDGHQEGPSPWDSRPTAHRVYHVNHFGEEPGISAFNYRSRTVPRCSEFDTRWPGFG